MTSTKIDNITLYNGDCMEYLRTLPDNAFDLAVVDPPYGDGNFQKPPHQAMNRDGGGGSTATKDHWNRFGARFDRYKRAEPTPISHGTIREVQPQLPPPLYLIIKMLKEVFGGILHRARNISKNYSAFLKIRLYGAATISTCLRPDVF